MLLKAGVDELAAGAVVARSGVLLGCAGTEVLLPAAELLTGKLLVGAGVLLC